MVISFVLRFQSFLVNVAFNEIGKGSTYHFINHAFGFRTSSNELTKYNFLRLGCEHCITSDGFFELEELPR